MLISRVLSKSNFSSLNFSGLILVGNKIKTQSNNNYTLSHISQGKTEQAKKEGGDIVRTRRTTQRKIYFSERSADGWTIFGDAGLRQYAGCTHAEAVRRYRKERAPIETGAGRILPERKAEM